MIAETKERKDPPTHQHYNAPRAQHDPTRGDFGSADQSAHDEGPTCREEEEEAELAGPHLLITPVTAQSADSHWTRTFPGSSKSLRLEQVMLRTLISNHVLHLRPSHICLI